MRKLLFAAVATAIVALQPTLALAQRTVQPPKEIPDRTTPTVTDLPTRLILQTLPVSATNAGLPAGILDTSRCIVGTGGGAVGPGTFEHIRFVGNVLCLDPGPAGDFVSLATGCPAGTDPVVQGLKLIKTVPRIPKCPDVYPGGTFVQTPVSTGIRTWWPLKYTPCDTEFLLEIEFGCVNRTLPRRITSVRVNRLRFRVTVTPGTLSWVVQALHNQPLATCEVPCITDEGLFDLLLRQADDIRRAADGGAAQIRALNTAIDVMEATIVARCLFTVATYNLERDAAGNITRITPCAIFPGGGPPGNYTIADLGYGIVDTLEDPCCCKLIADLYCLKGNLIGRDP